MILFGVMDAICFGECWNRSIEGKGETTYICDYEGFLERLISHFLNVNGHFVGSKIPKESHSCCLGAFDNAKVCIENHVSRTFLRINSSRGL